MSLTQADGRFGNSRFKGWQNKKGTGGDSGVDPRSASCGGDDRRPWLSLLTDFCEGDLAFVGTEWADRASRWRNRADKLARWLDA
jgi:hypothetical protein